MSVQVIPVQTVDVRTEPTNIHVPVVQGGLEQTVTKVSEHKMITFIQQSSERILLSFNDIQTI